MRSRLMYLASFGSKLTVPLLDTDAKSFVSVDRSSEESQLPVRRREKSSIRETIFGALSETAY